jgi:hypothetical protein
MPFVAWWTSIVAVGTRATVVPRGMLLRLCGLRGVCAALAAITIAVPAAATSALEASASFVAITAGAFAVVAIATGAVGPTVGTVGIPFGRRAALGGVEQIGGRALGARRLRTRCVARGLGGRRGVGWAFGPCTTGRSRGTRFASFAGRRGVGGWRAGYGGRRWRRCLDGHGIGGCRLLRPTAGLLHRRVIRRGGGAGLRGGHHRGRHVSTVLVRVRLVALR